MSDITLKLYNHYQRQGKQDIADAVLNLHRANQRYTYLLEQYLGVDTIVPTEDLLMACEEACLSMERDGEHQTTARSEYLEQSYEDTYGEDYNENL